MISENRGFNACICLLICSSDKYLLSIYYDSDTLLYPKDTAMNKTEKTKQTCLGAHNMAEIFILNSKKWLG